MAANADFKKVMVRDAVLKWPRLDQPYRFNTSKKESEPAAATAQGAAWSCGFELSMADAAALKKELQAHYEDCQTRNAKLAPFSKVFGAKVAVDEDSGTKTVIFRAKKSGVSGQGKQNAEPVVIDHKMQPLADRAIWGGSMGNLRLLAFPTTDPDGVGGISLLLDVIQITSAVYGGSNLEDDFSVEEGSGFGEADAGGQELTADDAFDEPEPARAKANPAAAKKPAAAPVHDDIDDEVPF